MCLNGIDAYLCNGVYILQFLGYTYLEAFGYLFVFWPVCLSCVITLFIIFNFWFVALLPFYVLIGIDA